MLNQPLQTTIQIPSEFQVALEASICQDSLYQFVVNAWHTVEQDDFVPNWHIEAICEYLQALYENRIPSRNLMINVPPGHTKSLLVNVFFPAWVWTKDASLKFLCYSYSADLTVRDSMKCRKLIASEWYQRLFGVQISQNEDLKDAFATVDGGYRRCFGLGGSLGGWRGDFLLIDDPLEMSKAESESARNMVNNAYDTAISSRETNPATTKRVIIMQRLHEEDLCGHLIEKEEEWEQLILPAEYDTERFISSIGFHDPRQVGELLWQDRFGTAYLKLKKNTLGTKAYAGQYQQRPAPLEGATFKKEWFKNRATDHKFVGFYLSADTATSLLGARSAIVVGGITEEYRLVPTLVWADKVEFPELVKKVVEIAERIPEQLLFDIVIENKSSGAPAIQTLQTEFPDWIARHVNGFTPKMEKEARAALASVWCENGSVMLPPPSEGNDWLFMFEDELFTFPNSKYKDMTDAFVQLILWLENVLSDGYHSRTGA